MPDLPEGTVTFLFTDLEGSTALLEAHPAAYREAMARHHALLRAAVEAHGGVVFETVGDAAYAAFARPTDAVAPALAGQRALHREDWGAAGPSAPGWACTRGGGAPGGALFRGGAVPLRPPDGHGPRGAGGALRRPPPLVRDALPGGGPARPGRAPAEGPAAPGAGVPAAAPGTAGGLPALRTLDALPHNLPLQVTSFVGRERSWRRSPRCWAPAPADAHRSGGDGQDPVGPPGGGRRAGGVPGRGPRRAPEAGPAPSSTQASAGARGRASGRSGRPRSSG